MTYRTLSFYIYKFIAKLHPISTIVAKHKQASAENKTELYFCIMTLQIGEKIEDYILWDINAHIGLKHFSGCS